MFKKKERCRAGGKKREFCRQQQRRQQLYSAVPMSVARALLFCIISSL